MLQKFLDVVLAVDGTVAARRFNKEYFDKHGHAQLWEWFVDSTNQFDQEVNSNRDKLWLIRNRHNVQSHCKVCSAPAPIVYTSDKIYIGEYCSVKCSRHCTDRAKKISDSKKNKSPEEKAAISAKAAATSLKNNGYEWPLQNPNRVAPRKDLPVDEIISLYCEEGKSALEIGKVFGVDYDTILTRLRENGVTDIRKNYNKSLGEKEMFEFCKIIDSSVIDDSNINGFLPDIYSPEKKVWIEYNGMWSHGYCPESRETTKDKHLRKFLAAQEQGIKILQFTDYQWKYKNGIVQSMINNALGKTHYRVYARNTVVHELSSEEAKTFTNDNHIQGHRPTRFYHGLFNDGKLVALMSVGIPRYNKVADWELIRFVVLNDHAVIGGFSKLLASFSGKISGKIVSYADCMYSNGNVYIKNGFELIKHTPPGYVWTDGNKRIWNRMKTQKHKLPALLGDKFDPSLSEDNNMYKANFRKYIDAGQLVFIKEL